MTYGHAGVHQGSLQIALHLQMQLSLYGVLIDWLYKLLPSVLCKAQQVGHLPPSKPRWRGDIALALLILLSNPPCPPPHNMN